MFNVKLSLISLFTFWVNEMRMRARMRTRFSKNLLSANCFTLVSKMLQGLKGKLQAVNGVTESKRIRVKIKRKC